MKNPFKTLMNWIDTKTNIIRPLFKLFVIIVIIIAALYCINMFEESQRGQNVYKTVSPVGYKYVDPDKNGYRDVKQYKQARQLTDNVKYKVKLTGREIIKSKPHRYSKVRFSDTVDKFYAKTFVDEFVVCNTKNGDCVYILIPNSNEIGEALQKERNDGMAEWMDVCGIIKHSLVMEDHSDDFIFVRGVPVLYPEIIVVNGKTFHYDINNFYDTKYNARPFLDDTI